jgi:hypothetical protein
VGDVAAAVVGIDMGLSESIDGNLWIFRSDVVWPHRSRWWPWPYFIIFATRFK